MGNKAGAFEAKRKDGSVYYRASVTYKNKHISLGSFDTEKEAKEAYLAANEVLRGTEETGVEEFGTKGQGLSFEKWVMLVNLRKSGIYCRNPILLEHKYFMYYVDRSTVLKFDVDDLFYYMNHKIMRRGGRFFVADYGMQVGILTRYGIKSFAVPGRDYVFKNGDETDLRYSNIEIINRYFGVFRSGAEGRYTYTAKVHLNGDNVIGHYSSEEDAAIAYNKATDVLTENGFTRPFYKNYIESLSDKAYELKYQNIKIAKRVYGLRP